MRAAPLYRIISSFTGTTIITMTGTSIGNERFESTQPIVYCKWCGVSPGRELQRERSTPFPYRTAETAKIEIKNWLTLIFPIFKQRGSSASSTVIYLPLRFRSNSAIIQYAWVGEYLTIDTSALTEPVSTIRIASLKSTKTFLRSDLQHSYSFPFDNEIAQC